jgi:hypothetical protein
MYAQGCPWSREEKTTGHTNNASGHVSQPKPFAFINTKLESRKLERKKQKKRTTTKAERQILNMSFCFFFTRFLYCSFKA